MPDLCVIGGGTAGHAAALGAAALGWRCTLIDPASELGRSQAADLAETLLFAMARDPIVPWDAAACRACIGQAVAAAAPNAAAARLRALGVKVLRGEASFVDHRTLVVAGQLVRARRFIVATGATPATPPWASADHRVIPPAMLLAGPAPWPAAMTLLAETPTGFEWAQALARCGVAVTLEFTPTASHPFDAELIALSMQGLRRDGVVLRERPSLAEPLRHDGGADPIMIFARPVPATTTLSLDRAGIRMLGAAPAVNGALRTSNRRVFALGDVLGRPAQGGAALPVDVGLVLRAMMFRLPARSRPDTVPLLLRTTPALAQVGDLRPRSGYRSHRISRYPLAEIAPAPRAQDTPGLVKIVSTPRGRILGAGVLGASAADAIGRWTLAVRGGLTLPTMASVAEPTETAGEAGRRAATGAIAARLRAPWIRRVSGWLRHLP